jgi:integrase
MEEANKSYINSYQRLFMMTRDFEEMHCKDLAVFSSKDLILVFKSIAKEVKYTTALTYNSLVDDYKEWASNNSLDATKETCSVDELKTIKDFKQYIILSEGEINNITKYAPLDGGDYNIALALKLFWDIDGQEDILDILKLKLEDINEIDSTITIHRTVYKVQNRKRTIIGTEPHVYNIKDGWIIPSLLEYAKVTSLEFFGRQGSYAILSAEENDGLIFRMTKTKRTKVGEPLDGVKFSNTFYQFCARNLSVTITINDILASLALRYMVQNKKSPAEMYTSKRYFMNMPSSVYAEIFKHNARAKYPKEFNSYVEYYRSLENEICNI